VKHRSLPGCKIWDAESSSLAGHRPNDPHQGVRTFDPVALDASPATPCSTYPSTYPLQAAVKKSTVENLTLFSSTGMPPRNPSKIIRPKIKGSVVIPSRNALTNQYLRLSIAVVMNFEKARRMARIMPEGSILEVPMLMLSRVR
jgi:hypothetical protein